MKIRKSAVAGRFYPANKEALIEQIDAHIAFENRDGAWFKICLRKTE